MSALSNSSKNEAYQDKCRSQLMNMTDEHLTSQLGVAATSVRADVDKIRKDSNFQVSL